jgi:hypothetical protein
VGGGLINAYGVQHEEYGRENEAPVVEPRKSSFLNPEIAESILPEVEQWLRAQQRAMVIRAIERDTMPARIFIKHHSGGS